MIDINKIRGRSSLTLLENYRGRNPYINNLKRKYLKNNKLRLTSNQSIYINDNYDKEPIKIDRVINISPYLGEQLKEDKKLSFTPERLLVEYILADTEKTFHVFGKLSKNQKNSEMYWLPKTQVLDDPYFEEIDVDIDFDKYVELDNKGRKPFKHQEDGVKFLVPRSGAILADGMGMGKTYQAIIAALEVNPKKVLIVCPSSLKINWEREINDFCDGTAIINGTTWDSDRFTIINYDILKNFHTLKSPKKNDPEDLVIEFNRQMVNSKFDMVIIDEAHYLKNPKSIRGEIMVDLCVNHDIKKVWLLTGTPIANKPMDFFNLLKLIKAPIADNWEFYARRYCAGRTMTKTLKNGRKKKIWLTDGASNLDELALKTKNVMLSRQKEDYLDLPEKIISPIYYELTKRGWDEYNGLWDKYLEKRREEGKKGRIDRDLVELILLRKHIAMEAIPYSIELAENAIDSGSKVVIFTNFTDELLELEEHFGNKCVTHHGSKSNSEKQDAVDRFQEDDKIKVFIGNIKSAGVGITLTAGNIVVFNSYDWVPGNNDQCEDRCMRIGQKNQVTVYYQLFKDTISEKMWSVLQYKKDIIQTIMGLKEYDEEEIILKMMEVLNEIEEDCNLYD